MKLRRGRWAQCRLLACLAQSREGTYESSGALEGRAQKGTELVPVQMCGEEIQSQAGTKNGGAGMLADWQPVALESMSLCLAGSELRWLAQPDRLLHWHQAPRQKEEEERVATWCVSQAAAGVAIAPGAASTAFPTRQGRLAGLTVADADAVLLTGICSSHSSCSAARAVMRLHKGNRGARGTAG